MLPQRKWPEGKNKEKRQITKKCIAYDEICIWFFFFLKKINLSSLWCLGAASIRLSVVHDSKMQKWGDYFFFVSFVFFKAEPKGMQINYAYVLFFNFFFFFVTDWQNKQSSRRGRWMAGSTWPTELNGSNVFVWKQVTLSGEFGSQFDGTHTANVSKLGTINRAANSTRHIADAQAPVGWRCTESGLHTSHFGSWSIIIISF